MIDYVWRINVDRNELQKNDDGVWYERHGERYRLHEDPEKIDEIRTFVVEEVPIEQRDFTKGEARKQLKELKNKGAICVKNQNELLSLLDVSKAKVKSSKEFSTKILGHLKPDTNSNEGDKVVVSKPTDNQR